MASTPAPYGIDNVVYGAGPNAYGATPAAYAATTPYRAGPAYAAAAPAYAAPVAPAAASPTYAAITGQPYTAPAPAYPAPTRPVYAAAAPAYAAPVTPAYAAPAAPAYAAPPAAPATYAALQQAAYRLDSGDRLRVVVFGQDGLTNSYVVDASGDIAMPLIGSVEARGLTTDQLSSRIADLLRQGYVRDPHVAVEVEAYRPFFILGEVTQPGQYPYVANMTVETAVAIAGGFTPRGYKQYVVITRNYGGQPYRFKTPTTAQVQPGDTIQVQERWF
ncbi:MAG TPA: polysaccharide biosynthesis/export family protein [Xanthobacteraceae bacterium]|nr:polysaccharide biosynthesis/export family protein [Xanthobacteraceae bacterium]